MRVHCFLLTCRPISSCFYFLKSNLSLLEITLLFRFFLSFVLLSLNYFVMWINQCSDFRCSTISFFSHVPQTYLWQVPQCDSWCCFISCAVVTNCGIKKKFVVRRSCWRWLSDRSEPNLFSCNSISKRIAHTKVDPKMDECKWKRFPTELEICFAELDSRTQEDLHFCRWC